MLYHEVWITHTHTHTPAANELSGSKSNAAAAALAAAAAAAGSSVGGASLPLSVISFRNSYCASLIIKQLISVTLTVPTPPAAKADTKSLDSSSAAVQRTVSVWRTISQHHPQRIILMADPHSESDAQTYHTLTAAQHHFTPLPQSSAPASSGGGSGGSGGSGSGGSGGQRITKLRFYVSTPSPVWKHIELNRFEFHSFVRHQPKPRPLPSAHHHHQQPVSTAAVGAYRKLYAESKLQNRAVAGGGGALPSPVTGSALAAATTTGGGDEDASGDGNEAEGDAPDSGDESPVAEGEAVAYGDEDGEDGEAEVEVEVGGVAGSGSGSGSGEDDIGTSSGGRSDAVAATTAAVMAALTDSKSALEDIL